MSQQDPRLPGYSGRTQESRGLHERASKALPAGVAAGGRFFSPYPLYFDSASGARLIDIDHNEYIDLVMGDGVHILGHSPPGVLRAVGAQLEKGVHFSAPTELEVTLAEKIRSHMPWVETTRFCTSGSEATQMALRVARACMGRPKFAKFEGGYHGQHDAVLFSALDVAGPQESPEPRVDSAGLSPNSAANVLVLPYNNTDAACSLISKHAAELSAVIIEPISGTTAGFIPAEPAFLASVRDVTTDRAIPLIFDEVITGFRLGLSGAAGHFGIEPDLTAFGKIIGGGFPIGAYGGRRELMEQALLPTTGERDGEAKVFQSGTFSGHPVSLIAGLSVVAELETGGVYEHLEELGRQTRRGLRALADRFAHVPFEVTGIASLFDVAFCEGRPRNKRDLLKADVGRRKDLAMGLIGNGVFFSPGDPGFLSAAHSSTDVELVLSAAEEVLGGMGR